MVEVAARSKPPCADDIPLIAKYVALFGGANAEMLNSIQRFVKTLKVKRVVRGNVYGALATLVIGPTTTIALMRAACLKAAYAAPDTQYIL
jgi:hypothetical protein